MSDFSKRAQMLNDLGVKFVQGYEYRGQGADRRPHPIEVFDSVDLPLSDRDWVNLASNNGNCYIGGCCGTCSAIQNIVDSWFRFHMHWVNTNDFEKIEDLWIAHGDEVTWVRPQNGQTLGEMFEEAKANWQSNDLWRRISYVWAIIKGFHNKSASGFRSVHKSYSEFEKALMVIRNVSATLGWAEHVDSRDELDPIEVLSFSKMLPALKTVYDRVSSMNQDFVGYALVDLKSGDGQICDGHMGLCIYPTVEEIWDVMNEQERYEAEYRELSKQPAMMERYAARPVKISVKDGLVFTGDIIKKPD